MNTTTITCSAATTVEIERPDLDNYTVWIDGRLAGIITKVEVNGEFSWCAAGSPLELVFSSEEDAINWCVAKFTTRQATPLPSPAPTPTPSPSPSPSCKPTKPDMSGYEAEPLPGDNILVTGPADQQYLVSFGGHKSTCTCPAGQHRKPCKHIPFAQKYRGQSIKSERFPNILVMLRHHDRDYSFKAIGSPTRTAWRVLDGNIQQEIGTVYCWTEQPGKAQFQVKPLGHGKAIEFSPRAGSALDDAIDTIITLREADKWQGMMMPV